MSLLVVFVVLLVVCAVVAWPLMHPSAEAAAARDADRIADLEAAKESKYREIRELELDHRTGKVSDADFRAQDRALRAQAIEILRDLDRLGASTIDEP